MKVTVRRFARMALAMSCSVWVSFKSFGENVVPSVDSDWLKSSAFLPVSSESLGFELKYRYMYVASGPRPTSGKWTVSDVSSLEHVEKEGVARVYGDKYILEEKIVSEQQPGKAPIAKLHGSSVSYDGDRFHYYSEDEVDSSVRVTRTLDNVRCGSMLFSAVPIFNAFYYVLGIAGIDNFSAGPGEIDSAKFINGLRTALTGKPKISTDGIACTFTMPNGSPRNVLFKNVAGNFWPVETSLNFPDYENGELRSKVTEWADFEFKGVAIKVPSRVETTVVDVKTGKSALLRYTEIERGSLKSLPEFNPQLFRPVISQGMRLIDLDLDREINVK